MSSLYDLFPSMRSDFLLCFFWEKSLFRHIFKYVTCILIILARKNGVFHPLLILFVSHFKISFMKLDVVPSKWLSSSISWLRFLFISLAFFRLQIIILNVAESILRKNFLKKLFLRIFLVLNNRTIKLFTDRVGVYVWPSK